MNKIINSKRKKIITVLLIFTFYLTYSQTQKEVENGVFVTFPTTVKYQANTQATTYIGKTDNCLFTSIVIRNFIPNYHKYIQAKKSWTYDEIRKVEDSFLDNAVKGKLDYTDNTGNIKKINIGKFNGRKIEYSAVNPLTGKRSKRFSLMLLVRDKLVVFECWYLKGNIYSKKEKDNFFNSIKSKF